MHMHVMEQEELYANGQFPTIQYGGNSEVNGRAVRLKPIYGRGKIQLQDLG